MDMDYQLLDFEDRKPVIPSKNACPKCGKPIGKGGHFHIRACDGNPKEAH